MVDWIPVKKRLKEKRRRFIQIRNVFRNFLMPVHPQTHAPIPTQ